MTTNSQTGRELAELVRAAARKRGVGITEFMRPISSNGTTLLKSIEAAQAPRKATRDRIVALLAGAPPTPPVGSAAPVDLPAPVPDQPPCPRCGWSGAMCHCALAAARPQLAPAPAPAPAPAAGIPPKPVGRKRTFEEQLAAVAAGAQLIEVRPLRMPPPERTLGGVGSGLLG